MGPRPRSGGPLQGLYESCAPSEASCLTRLDKMAAAGFTLVLNYAQEKGNAAEQIAYLTNLYSRWG